MKKSTVVEFKEFLISKGFGQPNKWEHVYVNDDGRRVRITMGSGSGLSWTFQPGDGRIVTGRALSVLQRNLK
jgi:hypothetical protein